MIHPNNTTCNTLLCLVLSLVVIWSMSECSSRVHGLQWTSARRSVGCPPVAMESSNSATGPSAHSSAVRDTGVIRIALTRELGNNSKLRSAIDTLHASTQFSSPVQLVISEMPCIQHAPGDDLHCFQKILSNVETLQRTCDYIIITSPESAHVFYQAVSEEPQRLPASVKIAAVGKATERELVKHGFRVHFVPSQADGDTLVRELPPISNAAVTKVLYPASAKAADTIPNGLEKGRVDAVFRVTRLNTYDTVAATMDTLALREFTSSVSTNIACFGSPSSVEAWLKNVDSINPTDPSFNGNVLAVCIGATTATACQESQRWQSHQIFFPKTNPGMEGWAQACITAIQSLL
jgi:uroporphyrinogen-III synthase